MYLFAATSCKQPERPTINVDSTNPCLQPKKIGSVTRRRPQRAIVLILDGNSDQVAQACREIHGFYIRWHLITLCAHME